MPDFVLWIAIGIGLVWAAFYAGMLLMRRMMKVSQAEYVQRMHRIHDNEVDRLQYRIMRLETKVREGAGQRGINFITRLLKDLDSSPTQHTLIKLNQRPNEGVWRENDII